MVDSLKSKALRAISWSFLESVGLRGVQFVIGIVLARLLLPEQFGLIGMLTIFMAIAQSLLDSGFGAALIQKRDAGHVDECSIFYFNIVVGSTAAGLLCLAAPAIARFYDQPILTPLTRVMSLILVINSFSVVQQTLLTKQINFKATTKITLAASALSGTIGVSLAVLGFGVWSLVVQQVSSAFFHTVLMWVLNTWRPTLVFSFKSLRGMFGFGSKVMLSGLLNRVFENIYLVVIGKLFSATDLGFFTRAQKLQDLPTLTLSWMVGRVAFPVFSTIQDDTARLKRGLRSILTGLVLANFPMMVGIAVVARPLVLVLLTEKWAPCIPYLRLLCLAGLLSPMNWFNVNVLYAIGRSDLCLRLEIIKKTMTAINIAVAWRWGIEAMISGQVIISVISYFLNSHYTGILIGYRTREQLQDLSSYFVPPVLMGVGVYLVARLPWPGVWSLLLAQIVTGVVLYLSLCRVLRLPVFLQMWEIGWKRIPFLKTESV